MTKFPLYPFQPPPPLQPNPAPSQGDRLVSISLVLVAGVLASSLASRLSCL